MVATASPKAQLLPRRAPAPRKAPQVVVIDPKVGSRSRDMVPATIAEARGYQRADLLAIGEIAYHYLINGGLEIALALFDGLSAIAPGEPYYALALGFTYDRLNDKRAAHAWYQRATALDPGEARSDINRAELYLEDRDFDSARRLFSRGLDKARARGDFDLAKKASALLAHVGQQELRNV